MKWYRVVAVAIGCALLQYGINTLVVIQRERVKEALHANGKQYCHFMNTTDSSSWNVAMTANSSGFNQSPRYYVKKSDIHMLGMFPDEKSISCGDFIASAFRLKEVRALKDTFLAFSFWSRTKFTRRLNHSPHPTARVVFDVESNEYVLFAIKDIDIGEEITTDYLDLPWFTLPPSPTWDFSVTGLNTEERYMRFAVIVMKWLMIPITILAFG